MKYSNWVTWMVVSIIVFLIILLMMTLENSREIKELPYIFTLAFINLCIVSYYGFKPVENDTHKNK